MNDDQAVNEHHFPRDTSQVLNLPASACKTQVRNAALVAACVGSKTFVAASDKPSALDGEGGEGGGSGIIGTTKFSGLAGSDDLAGLAGLIGLADLAGLTGLGSLIG